MSGTSGDKNIQPDPSKASLNGMISRGAYLSGVDFSEADLSEVDLTRTYLIGARLRRANLHGADLSFSDLRLADLYQSDLSMALLRRYPLTSLLQHSDGDRNTRVPTIVVFWLKQESS